MAIVLIVLFLMWVCITAVGAEVYLDSLDKKHEDEIEFLEKEVVDLELQIVEIETEGKLLVTEAYALGFWRSAYTYCVAATGDLKGCLEGSRARYVRGIHNATPPPGWSWVYVKYGALSIQ